MTARKTPGLIESRGLVPHEHPVAVPHVPLCDPRSGAAFAAGFAFMALGI